VIYCINPDCKQRQNPDNLECCQTCGTPLLIHERYRLLKPLRPLDPRTSTDIFEVDDGGTRKVMKVLKDSRPQLVEGFEREALTLELLKHPGIPKVDLDGYFTFTPSNSTRELHCLVMEKIEGQNLDQWLAKEGPIPSESLAINWLRQLIEILDQVHKSGFFHRDIKPSNIILKPDGQLVLIDFGSVREMTHTYLAKLKGGLNVTAIISGGYTPQEQVDGKALPQSDFYALGRTFVHLLTGKHPSDFPREPDTGKLIWQDKAPQISKPLADFIDDMMAILPADRPKTTAEILRDLTPKRLLGKSVQRQVSSPQFRLGVAALLLMGLIYRLSFPWQAQSFYERGVEALKVNQLESARKFYKRALEFNTKDARIYNDMGLICQIEGNSTCARVYYEKALKLNPENPVARYNLGGYYDDSGEFQRAEAQYQLAIQSKSPVAANATSDLARLKILQGEPATAIDLSLRGLQQTEKKSVLSALHKNLGWAYFMQTDYARAEVVLRQAIELNSKRADAYCLLAQVLEARGDRGGALAQWKNCLDLDSRNRVEVKTWQTLAIQRLKGEEKGK
jgi:serine/threonine protein kinase